MKSARNWWTDPTEMSNPSIKGDQSLHFFEDRYKQPGDLSIVVFLSKNLQWCKGIVQKLLSFFRIPSYPMSPFCKDVRFLQVATFSHSSFLVSFFLHLLSPFHPHHPHLLSLHPHNLVFVFCWEVHHHCKSYQWQGFVKGDDVVLRNHHDHNPGLFLGGIFIEYYYYFGEKKDRLVQRFRVQKGLIKKKFIVFTILVFLFVLINSGEKKLQKREHTTKHHQTPPNITKHYQTPPNTTKHHQTPPNITKHHQTPPNTTKHQTPLNTNNTKNTKNTKTNLCRISEVSWRKAWLTLVVFFAEVSK